MHTDNNTVHLLLATNNKTEPLVRPCHDVQRDAESVIRIFSERIHPSHGDARMSHALRTPTWRRPTVDFLKLVTIN